MKSLRLMLCMVLFLVAGGLKAGQTDCGNNSSYYSAFNATKATVRDCWCKPCKNWGTDLETAITWCDTCAADTSNCGAIGGGGNYQSFDAWATDNGYVWWGFLAT